MKRLIHYRALKALPHDETKRERVIYRMADSICPNVLQQPIETHRQRVSSNVRDAVTAFYLREDVSMTMPGHADTVVVREGGVKMKMQKRFLTTSLEEAYAHYVEECGKGVSLSFFCEMRPKHVHLCGDIPHNVCACRTHEDFIAYVKQSSLMEMSIAFIVV